MLLEHGAFSDPIGSVFGLHAPESPLHVAANLGDEALAGILVENGADINGEDEGGMTPLDLAEVGLVDAPAEEGHLRVIEMLKSHGGRNGNQE